MHSFQEPLASWATILGTVFSVIGLIQSRGWLAGISALFIGASIFAGLYARRKRLALDSAAVKVEGHSIDSLNIANLRRRVNRSLVIQEVNHVARIEGEDLKMTWQYAGYARADHQAAIEFSIDSDNNIPFEALDCFAYDLQRDPGRKHKIRPVLLGTDGISKKIAIPFLEPLTAQQPFAVLLKCGLPGCMKAGFEYYTSTLSFDQDRVPRLTVRLVFAGARPSWVRVYECSPSGSARLLKELRPWRESQECTEYQDTAEEVPGQSARIYVFWRAAAS
ncbi:MAG: hypothetical protein Q8Q12_03010 [bacterium]|nr:hypothetical protein [bacterium]